MRAVRVATSGRRYRTYIGTIQGRRMPGGPRPVEQVVAFLGGLVATMGAAQMLPYPTPAVFGVGVLLSVGLGAAMGLVTYDGVPIVGQGLRYLALLVDRRPVVVAGEEASRQQAANPQAFLIVDEATIGPLGEAG